MKFRRIDGFYREWWVQGFVRVSLETLVQHFGDPDYVDQDEPSGWSLEFDDGTRANIYDHIQEHGGLGPGSVPSRKFMWFVRGYRHASVFRVAEVLGTQAIIVGEDGKPPVLPF